MGHAAEVWIALRKRPTLGRASDVFEAGSRADSSHSSCRGYVGCDAAQDVLATPSTAPSVTRGMYSAQRYWTEAVRLAV